MARLAARRMPLPGRPYPTPSVRLPAAENFVGTVPEVDHTRSPIVPASSVSMTARPENRPDLTDREIEVLCAWLQLDSKPAVAQELFISLGTVNTHLTRIRAKYADCGRAARTKAALVARAVQDGLISLDDL